MISFDRKIVIGQEQRIGFRRGMKKYIHGVSTKEISGFLVTNGVIFTLTTKLVKAQLK